jgi:hypothetical protein
MVKIHSVSTICPTERRGEFGGGFSADFLTRRKNKSLKWKMISDECFCVLIIIFMLRCEEI